MPWGFSIGLLLSILLSWYCAALNVNVDDIHICLMIFIYTIYIHIAKDTKFIFFIKVVHRTIPERRNDLVFVNNGIPSDFLDTDNAIATDSGTDGFDINQITTSVPYFGVLAVGQDPISGDSFPPTIINNGRHANFLADLLTRNGVGVKIVHGVREVDKAAIRKLFWVSIMWLLCADGDRDGDGNDDGGIQNEDMHLINMMQVHERRPNDVRDLVQEMIPAANLLLQKYHYDESDVCFDNNIDIGSVDEIVEEMEAYSRSMPTSIPNKMKAIDEFAQRNGFLLGMRKTAPQPLHEALIQKVVGYIPGCFTE